MKKSESVGFLLLDARCFNDVDDVVAEFLALRDEVHVIDTNLIAVELVVDVNHILVLELRAVVVDFMLDDLLTST